MHPCPASGGEHVGWSTLLWVARSVETHSGAEPAPAPVRWSGSGGCSGRGSGTEAVAWTTQSYPCDRVVIRACVAASTNMAAAPARAALSSCPMSAIAASIRRRR